MNPKALYFVTKEKKIKHIGFYTELGHAQLLESAEILEQHGFGEDPTFLRETEDAGYVFSSVLPQSVIDIWFTQIINERARLKKGERGKGGKEEKREKEEKIEKVKKVEKSVKPVRRVLPRARIRTPRKAHTKVKKIWSFQVKGREPTLPKRTAPRRKKTLDMLKEEVRAQRRWETFVPTCGECVFWEKQFLRFTQEVMGGCKITGNFVDEEKKACSEFERS